ncbi:MAG: hypothetical protein V4525_03280 [Pseudomonadota bacterium]
MATGFLKFLLTIFYPVIIYYALNFFSPRVVGLIVLVTLFIKHYHQTQGLWSGLAKPQKWVFYILVLFSLNISFFNSELLLKLFPAFVSLSMLFLFSYTLFYPPSMIERFARLSKKELPSTAIFYTRKVTYIWCGFFIININFSLITVFCFSKKYWLIYNGFVSYLLMGLLMGGEWIYRYWRLPESRNNK